LLEQLKLCRASREELRERRRQHKRRMREQEPRFEERVETESDTASEASSEQSLDSYAPHRRQHENDEDCRVSRYDANRPAVDGREREQAIERDRSSEASDTAHQHRLAQRRASPHPTHLFTHDVA
jgi:hypothetical protein